MKNAHSLENSVEPSARKPGHDRNRSHDFQTPRQQPVNGRSPGMGKNGLNKNDLLERASQIEKDRQRKEQEVINENILRNG